MMRLGCKAVSVTNEEVWTVARRLGVVCVFMVVPRCGKSPEKMKVAVHGKWEEVKGSRTPKI